MSSLHDLKDTRILFPFSRSPWIRNLLYFLVYEEVFLLLDDNEEEKKNTSLDSSIQEHVNDFFSKWFEPSPTIGLELIHQIVQQFRDPHHRVTHVLAPVSISYWDRITEENKNHLLNLLFDEKNEKEKPTHVGYPLPHETQGRPTIDMRECLHANCLYQRAKFSSGNALISHLEHMNCYTPFFHQRHQGYIDMHHAKAIEKYKEDKNITCPIFGCSKPFPSYEELVYHFEELGIEPFWKPGWTPKVKPKYETNKILVPKKEKLILNGHILVHKGSLIEEENVCICCEEESSELVFNCGHKTIGLNCYTKLTKHVCPICREKIDFVFPSF